MSIRAILAIAAAALPLTLAAPAMADHDDFRGRGGEHDHYRGGEGNYAHGYGHEGAYRGFNGGFNGARGHWDHYHQPVWRGEYRGGRVYGGGPVYVAPRPRVLVPAPIVVTPGYRY